MCFLSNVRFKKIENLGIHTIHQPLTNSFIIILYDDKKKK